MILINVAVIDSDFIINRRQRFPKLACMKISAFYKSIGDTVTLKTDYSSLEKFDKVFLSKIFSETHCTRKRVVPAPCYLWRYGLFYDKAKFLPEETEHIKPDYRLYDDYIQDMRNAGEYQAVYKYFVDYFIGYTTRFCFRKCGFCVNKNYNGVRIWSAIGEFLDTDRRKICLLPILEQLQKIGKPFQYKQGLDIKLLNNRNAALLNISKYDGEYLFSFDDADNSEIITRKLEL